MPRHHVTQADVAAMAGVSQPTVSFVLNGSAPAGVRISEATRARVLDAIRITGYSANPVAQRLASGRNQILGIFTYETTFPRGGNDFYNAILHGIEHAAERLGVDTLLFTSARVVDGRRRLAHDGWQRLGIADGCLLLGHQEDHAELQKLLDTAYPFVFVGKREREGQALSYVGADYAVATARQLARLTALGHRRIGYVASPFTDEPAQDRLAGYREGVRTEGIAPCVLEPGSASDVASEIVGRGLSAVLVTPETDAEALADALEARGLRVPLDVSMLLLGQPLNPRRGGRRWSGFAVPREEMGARAVLLLSRIIDQQAASAPPLNERDLHQLLDCADVEGATLAPAPTTPPREGSPA
ncbi:MULTISPECIES: LacI family DNA-binding transcriptional regulator [unclassified Microbacterium]|uniref:LacI family DNA-binding transcriptional regulator n=1 Tax=unclassified Microbacterium TaxID=2609290 RepID=UPI0012FA9C8E|nr:LacI family DNA-binding transcriptional regulator [Microbacterium sp. MAH-37]MVQ44080.1 LacI family DNA-binding transcriptional regulator [Microbacterium sp. MAH-37]